MYLEEGSEAVSQDHDEWTKFIDTFLRGLKVLDDLRRRLLYDKGLLLVNGDEGG